MSTTDTHSQDDTDSLVANARQEHRGAVRTLVDAVRNDDTDSPLTKTAEFEVEKVYTGGTATPITCIKLTVTLGVVDDRQVYDTLAGHATPVHSVATTSSGEIVVRLE